MGVEGDNGRCGLCIRITKWLPVVFILAVIAWSYFAFVVQLCLYTMEEVWLKVIWRKKCIILLNNFETVCFCTVIVNVCLWQVLSLIIYHISLTLFLWAYFQTIFTTSNRVPRKFKIPQSKYLTKFKRLCTKTL